MQKTRRLPENRSQLWKSEFWPIFPIKFVKYSKHSPHLIKKLDSKPLSLTTASIFEQSPRQKAFTLIELLIVVAIVGILSFIAYPAYIDQVGKTKEAEAKAALVSFSATMGQYFLDGTTYVGATTAIFSDKVPLDGGTKTYTLSITSLSQLAYTLKAVPVDSALETFCLDESGAKDDCNGNNNW